MSGSELSIRVYPEEISGLMQAAAISKGAMECADGGSEREALRIAIDLDELLSEAATLHGAMCLVGRLRRRDDRAALS